MKIKKGKARTEIKALEMFYRMKVTSYLTKTGKPVVVEVPALIGEQLMTYREIVRVERGRPIFGRVWAIGPQDGKFKLPVHLRNKDDAKRFMDELERASRGWDEFSKLAAESHDAEDVVDSVEPLRPSMSVILNCARRPAWRYRVTVVNAKEWAKVEPKE